MLLMPQKKKISSVFVSKLAGEGEGDSADFVQRLGEESEPVDSESDSPEPDAGAEEAAMKSFLRAFERKDSRGMASAMKDFWYLCEGTESEEFVVE